MEFKGKHVTVRDKRGIELQAGDIIAMGIRAGNSGSIRIGKILEYLEYPQQFGKPNCYLKVEWLKLDSIWTPDRATRIHVTTDNNVVDRNRYTDYWREHEFVKVVLPQ
jgi:hypothetical protein